MRRVPAAGPSGVMAALARPLRGAVASLRALPPLRAARGGAGRSGAGTEVLGKGFKRGVVLSAGSFLVYEAYGLISRFAEVHASSKVEEVVEQADYLYGSGETEKLYHLLVQHKTRMRSCCGGWPEQRRSSWFTKPLSMQKRHSRKTNRTLQHTR
uniref:Regulator of microtubule dynamics 1 n=1 Tax=Nothoprocta perdicaria TaxID=30464 RepID=A0A8C6ZVK3_NOTPE